MNIKDRYETFAVVPRGKSKLQVYMTISNGTNGAEGCSLSEDVKYLNRDIETSTVGYFIEEDDKAIVLASSIYGINIPDSLCKDCMVIPKAYIKDITSIGTELVAQLLYFLQQRNYITEEQMNDACNEILKSN